MADAHAALGLGAFPEGPVTEYLARSASALYALRGALLLLASSDVRRYSALIAFLGVTGCIFGAAMILIDLKAAMPWWWTLAEGPSVLAGNALILALLRRSVAGEKVSGRQSAVGSDPKPGPDLKPKA